MSVDYEKLRTEEADKSSKLQELMSVPSNQNDTNPIVLLTNTNKHQRQNQHHNHHQPHSNNHKHQITTSTTTPPLVGSPSHNNTLVGKTHKNQFNQHHQLQQHKKQAVHTAAVSAAAVAGSLLSPAKSAKHLSVKSLSLFGTLCHTVPLAMPTLQLHLIISLTLVWLTHRCPQYLIIL